ncbi:hypothetical protein P7C71_g4345, partial [Lecanoromycetidae sp. Uapishka_2]
MPRLRPLGLESWLGSTRRTLPLEPLGRATYATAPWRPAAVLDDSANYVRTELPTRLAHRLRDMQTLPFVVVTNPHMSHVYDLYYKAFETLRKIREIKSVEDNEKYCKVISETLEEHLTVIPRLAMGVLECQDLMPPNDMDKFMNTLLRSISKLGNKNEQLSTRATMDAV